MCLPRARLDFERRMQEVSMCNVCVNAPVAEHDEANNIISVTPERLLSKIEMPLAS